MMANENKAKKIITWRHADGSVRVDHMDSRLDDYFGSVDEATDIDEAIDIDE